MANAQSLKFPAPLGLLKAGASYATVAVPLNVNLPATMPDGVASSQPFNEIEVTALAANTGIVYICVPLVGQAASAVADLTGYTNVIALLNAGDTWPREGNAEWSNKWNPGDYYLSFANATDSCFGSVGRF